MLKIRESPGDHLLTHAQEYTLAKRYILSVWQFLRVLFEQKQPSTDPLAPLSRTRLLSLALMHKKPNYQRLPARPSSTSSSSEKAGRKSGGCCSRKIAEVDDEKPLKAPLCGG